MAEKPVFLEFVGEIDEICYVRIDHISMIRPYYQDDRTSILYLVNGQQVAVKGPPTEVLTRVGAWK